MDLPGEYETHITVGLPEGADLDSLRRWGEGRGLKFHHIVLDRGRSASQPMLTRTGRGRRREELATAEDLVGELDRAGFEVVRVKVEAAPSNAEVPRTEADAAREPAERYFEHHVKLLLAPDADLRPLATLAEAHGAHLSRNARRVRGDGRRERFVTQRCRGVDSDAASGRLEALLQGIHAGNYPVLEVEREYVVFDSNLALDAGWITPGD